LDAVRDLDEEGIRSIFARPGRLIATFRPGRVEEAARFRVLRLAVEAGAAFVDIEIEALGQETRGLIRAARKKRCRVIISYHNLSATPALTDLERTRDRAFAAGADVVKIACRSRCARDNARLLGLLDDPRPTIAIGLGAKGAITRIAAPLLGSPFTYAAAGPGRETAPGQPAASVLTGLWKALEHV
jgi:3-dehydroquinate dehydratase type I